MKTHSHVPLYILLIISICFLSPQLTYGSVTAVKTGIQISIKLAKQLAQIGKTKGSKEVAKRLLKEAEKVPIGQRAKFFESAYAKILVQQNRATPAQADEWLRNLSSTPGFRNTLSKMCGKSPEKYIGHKFEIQTANELAKNNYKVLAIGQRYNDTIKKAATDIDVIAKKGNKVYAFELKNYDKYKIGLEQVSGAKSFVEDMKSLKMFALENPNTIPVLIIRNKPIDKTITDILLANGKVNGVKVIFGDPKTAIQILEYM